MTRDLMSGHRTSTLLSHRTLIEANVIADMGQLPEDVAKYNEFVRQVPMITPTVAGNAFARTVTSVDASLCGTVLDYDDPRLPLDETAKRVGSAESTGHIDYTKFTS